MYMNTNVFDLSRRTVQWKIIVLGMCSLCFNQTNLSYMCVSVDESQATANLWKSTVFIIRVGKVFNRMFYSYHFQRIDFGERSDGTRAGGYFRHQLHIPQINQLASD